VGFVPLVFASLGLSVPMLVLSLMPSPSPSVGTRIDPIIRRKESHQRQAADQREHAAPGI
jgi:hypothetical protein